MFFSKLFGNKIKRVIAAAVAATAIATAGAAIVAPQEASAAAWTCRTLYVSKSSITYSPHMYVPVCYNGSQIYVNGGVTPGVTLIGYQNDGYTWYGTYNDSSHAWLGVGENMNITAGIGPLSYTLSCDPRWYVNAWGNVYSSSYGC